MTVATSPPTSTPDPLLGTTFEGRYRIESLLGRGGFGAVYRATQIGRGFERPVALKVLDARHVTDPDEVLRFEQEARIVATLDHPHVVRLHEAGHASSGALYIVMELVEGESLARRVRRDGPLVDVDVVTFGRQILEALAEAHAHGVVHRDLKTENLQVTRHARRGDIVKLLDFGIAKATVAPSGAPGAVPRTRAGLVVGTPRIMAPEQICRDPITARTDLYAFGCVMYELLTGRPPFVCRSAGAYARAHLTETPAWPVRRGDVLAGPLVELVMQCLEKRPNDRPPSAEALLEVWPHEGLAITATPTRSHPAPPPPLPTAAPSDEPSAAVTVTHRPRVRRRATRMWIAAALALVLLAAFVWSVHRSPRAVDLRGWTGSSEPATPGP